MAKRQRAVPQQGKAPPRGKRRKQKSDVYEAEDSDPDEEKHTDRFDHVENYEYELPSDFEDEEIDEDMAFTAEDKKRYAGWFGDDDADAAATPAGRGGRKERAEFADLESSEEGAEEEGSEHESDLDFEDGGDMLAALDGDAAATGGGGSSDELLGGSSGGEEEEEEEEGEEGGGEGEDDDAYRDMLAAAVGRGHDDARAARRARAPRVVAEAYPESEFAGADAEDGGGAGGALRLSDLVAGLGDARPRLGASRKALERMERRGAPVEAPLPRAVRERQERKAGYEETSRDVTKWQPMVKANREAPTLRFTSARHEVPDRGASTQALLEGFKPEGDMEAEVAALLQEAGAAGSRAMAEAERALAEQTLTPEEAKERAARLAKMRNVLFYAELKAKRLSKIKSKEYHRRTNKAAKRAAARALAAGGAPDGPADADADGAEGAAARRAAREEAEFERARERLTLKHKNTSRWARRALKRGVDVMDDGTRAALAEQQSLGAALRRRIEGRGSGSGSGSDGGGGSGGSTSASEGEGGGGGGGGSQRAKAEAVSILQGLSAPPGEGGAGDEATAQAGLFALPFMRRALEKQRRAAAAEAEALIRELDGGGGDGAEEDPLAPGGRLRFGGAGGAEAERRRQAEEEAEEQRGAGSEEDGSDMEEDAEAKAQRLGRRLRGEAEAEPEGGGRRRGGLGAAAADEDGAAAAAAAAMPARGLRRGAVATATEGPVDVDMGGLQGQQQQQQQQGAAMQNGKPSKQRRGGKGAAAAAAEAAQQAAALRTAPAGAHDWLFDAAPAAAAAAGGGGAAGARRKQRRQEASGGGNAAGPEQRPAFVAAESFGGARDGYVFKRGPQGVGYYSDTAQGAAAATGGKASTRGGKQQQAAGAGQKAGDGARRRRGGGDGSSSGDEQQQQQQQQQAAANGKAGKHTHADGANGAAANGASEEDERAHHMAPLSGDADAQRALLRRAFAADDVAAEFAAEKAEEVEAELPKEETPGLMPGWGLWADQQREPKWMADARAKAARRKAAAAAARQDAKMAHVVISEKWDKKAAKYGASSLPFPFRSADAYENSIRQPLGRDVNPDAAFRNLTRPAVIKATGVVIDPLRYSKGVADYGAGKAARARGVVTVAGGVPLQGEGPGGGAGGGAAGGGKKGGGGKGSGKKGSGKLGGGGGKGGGKR